MRLSKVLLPSVVVVLLLCLAGKVLAVGASSGRALVPKDLATPEQLFNACQDAIVQAGYNISSMDKANGLISASHEQGMFGSKKTYTYTWNVTIRPREAEGVTEVIMARNTTGTFTPNDLKKLYPYIFEQMKLDLAKIEVTIDGETRKASEWR